MWPTAIDTNIFDIALQALLFARFKKIYLIIIEKEWLLEIYRFCRVCRAYCYIFPNSLKQINFSHVVNNCLKLNPFAV
jgi:hypothetical protein